MGRRWDPYEAQQPPADQAAPGGSGGTAESWLTSCTSTSAEVAVGQILEALLPVFQQV